MLLPEANLLKNPTQMQSDSNHYRNMHTKEIAIFLRTLPVPIDIRRDSANKYCNISSDDQDYNSRKPPYGIIFNDSPGNHCYHQPHYFYLKTILHTEIVLLPEANL